VGTPVTSPSLPDPDGRLISLDDFRGKRVLLVHWNPDCAFCELLASDLAQFQADLRTSKVQLVLASSEDAKSNRELALEHGLTCPILLMPDDGPLARETFKDQGTPVAYLLDEQGKVAQPVAVGGDEFLALARGVVGKPAKRIRLPGERPLSQRRIERHGFKAGTIAPAFRLPDLRGATVALEDYRGRSVLLVFSDPHCGHCEELAPHFVRIHRECRGRGLVVLMVTRGGTSRKTAAKRTGTASSSRWCSRIAGDYPKNTASSRCRWPFSSMRKGLLGRTSRRESPRSWGSSPRR
jgi:peroxiredoxin